jgi:hypothetical protein
LASSTSSPALAKPAAASSKTFRGEGGGRGVALGDRVLPRRVPLVPRRLRPVAKPSERGVAVGGGGLLRRVPLVPSRLRPVTNLSRRGGGAGGVGGACSGRWRAAKSRPAWAKPVATSGNTCQGGGRLGRRGGAFSERWRAARSSSACAKPAAASGETCLGKEGSSVGAGRLPRRVPIAPRRLRPVAKLVEKGGGGEGGWGGEGVQCAVAGCGRERGF